jgi:hypothetical protein
LQSVLLIDGNGGLDGDPRRIWAAETAGRSLFSLGLTRPDGAAILARQVRLSMARVHLIAERVIASLAVS